MSLSDLLQIGDEVIFKIDPEVRAWTPDYNNVPDGTKGIVCGFYDVIAYEPRYPIYSYQPGTYHRKGEVSVWLADGRVVPGGNSISMVDKNEEDRRDATMRDKSGRLRYEELQVRLGDLPATRFWEQDKVRVRFPRGDVHEMTISHISYSDMHNRRIDGSPYPFYDVAYTSGGTSAAEESWIDLIERGNVWKYYHNQPLSFASLEEEAGFYQLMGQTEQLRNPATGNYGWEKDEVLDAIKNGTAHGFSVTQGFFGSGPHVSALRYQNEDLGKRVAQATLTGFNMASA